MTPSARRQLPAILFLLAVTVTACEPRLTDSWPDGDGPPVALAVQADVTAAGMISLITVSVTGPGIPVPILANLEVEDGQAQGTITVPAGNDRVFEAQAFSAQGDVTHEGTVTQDVRPNMPAVKISLIPRGIGVPIEVETSAFQVAIDPTAMALEVGQTGQLTATVTDGAGEPVDVEPGQLTWGSTNPATVQVDGTGLATALVPGTAQVVVSFQGVAAAATVDVAGGVQSDAWRQTVIIDGDPDDFGPDAKVASDGGDTWITWDDTHLYVGLRHPDVETGGPEHWVLIYLGNGVDGTTEGVAHNTQQPGLPTPMSHLVRRKADGSYNGLLTWDGSWVETPDWLGTDGSDVAVQDDGLEFALPLAALGIDDIVKIHVSWVHEGFGFESSYGASPAGSFPEGTYDPDYTLWWEFDRNLPDAPATYQPMP